MSLLITELRVQEQILTIDELRAQVRQQAKIMEEQSQMIRELRTQEQARITRTTAKQFRT